MLHLCGIGCESTFPHKTVECAHLLRPRLLVKGETLETIATGTQPDGIPIDVHDI
jgi:hypothetical protein